LCFLPPHYPPGDYYFVAHFSVTTNAGASLGPFTSPVVPTYLQAFTAPALQTVEDTLHFDSFAGLAPPPQPLTIYSRCGQAIAWTATTDAAWLTVTPTAGSTDGDSGSLLSVAIDPAGLAPGTHTAHVIITAPGTIGSPLTVDVTLILVE
jgi:hypothetical protein